MQNPKLASAMTIWRFPPRQQKQKLPLLITHQSGTQRVHWNCKFAQFPLKINISWNEKSSQSDQRNRITLHDQEKYIDCRVLRNDSKGIRVYSTSRHGNLQPDSKKNWQHYLSFMNFPRMVEKLIPFDKLSKSEKPVKIMSKHKETFHSDKALRNAGEFALKQPLPKRRLSLKTDASFRSALMIKYNPEQKIQSKRKM